MHNIKFNTFILNKRRFESKYVHIKCICNIYNKAYKAHLLSVFGDFVMFNYIYNTSW